METDSTTHLVNSTPIPDKSPIPEHSVKNQKGYLPVILGLLVLLLVVGGGVYFLGSNSSLSQLNKKQVIETTNPTALPTTINTPTAIITIPANGSMANWKTYRSSGVFSLSNTILQKYPTLAKGNLTVKYPPTWELYLLKPEASNNNKYGVSLEPNLIKTHPKFTSAGETPPLNSAFITFSIKETSLTPDILVYKYSEEFGEGSIYNTPIPNQQFNNYKGAKIMTTQLIPHAIVFSIFPNIVMNINIDFYDNGEDKEYSARTIQEISEILNSVQIIK